MLTTLKTFALALFLGVLPATALAASSPGTWHKRAREPVALPYGAGVWTGSNLLVFGRRPLTKATFNPSANAAMSFDPGRNTWKTLAPPPQVGGGLGCCRAVWTGQQMLVFGANLGYRPSTNAWRTLHASLPEGIVAWTGREAIGWGGGCCGDAVSSGGAYNPAKDTSRTLPHSPLAPSQTPIGAWDGHELLIFVSGYDTEGKPYPARYARAAAYDPHTNAWRRIAALPATGPRFSGSAVWTGRELVVAGAGAQSRAALAYAPARNRWRRLAPLPSSRAGAAAFWTGDRVLLWGASARGLAYDPRANRWATLPPAPLRAPETTSAVWTGRSLLAFGGIIGSSAATHNQQVWLREVAAFTPAARRS